MLPEETPSQPELIPVVEPPIAEYPPPQLPPVQKPARDPFWNYADLGLVLGMMVAAMALIVLGAAAAAIIWPNLRVDQTPLILPTNLAMYFFLLLILKLDFSTRYGRPVLPSLGWRVTNAATLGFAVLAGIALPFIVSAIGDLLHTPKVTTPMDKIPNSIPLSIMAVVLAPFFEELFFRGFLQPLFVRSFGVIFGVFITGVLFGGVHAVEYSFIWQYVVAISVVGWALGAVRVWTNSIVPTAIMHACFNGLQVVAFAVSKHQ